MKIYALRIEQIDGKSYLTANVKCGFSSSKTLWFSVSDEYASWLADDVYDAFLVAALWPCMCYGEDIEIDGNVSKKIYKNICSFVKRVIKGIEPSYDANIRIAVRGYADAKKNDEKIVGTGFSGGVDSFSTLVDRFENEDDGEFKINTLFFFHIGQYGNIADKNTAHNAYSHYLVSKKYANEVGLPFVYMDSNMFEFYQPQWEYDAGPLCRISSILAFQRALIRYYVSGSYSYFQLCDLPSFELFDDVSDPFIYLILSPNNLDIELDGSQYYRSEKIEKIASYPPTYKHLNVCVSPNIDVTKDKNCSICFKCNRTLIILEALGMLEKYSGVFDIERYKSQSFRFKCWVRLKAHKEPFYSEIIRYLDARGTYIPSCFCAWLYLFPQRVKGKLRAFLKS